LRRLSSKSTAELRAAIEAFIASYATHAKPFKWRKREAKGSQLRNTIVTLCNQALDYARENQTRADFV